MAARPAGLASSGKALGGSWGGCWEVGGPDPPEPSHSTGRHGAQAAAPIASVPAVGIPGLPAGPQWAACLCGQQPLRAPVLPRLEAEGP